MTNNFSILTQNNTDTLLRCKPNSFSEDLKKRRKKEDLTRHPGLIELLGSIEAIVSKYFPKTKNSEELQNNIIFNFYPFLNSKTIIDNYNTVLPIGSTYEDVNLMFYKRCWTQVKEVQRVQEIMRYRIQI